MPWRVTAEGLLPSGSGEGVIYCADEASLFKALRELVVERIFGASGDRVVIDTVNDQWKTEAQSGEEERA